MSPKHAAPQRAHAAAAAAAAAATRAAPPLSSQASLPLLGPPSSILYQLSAVIRSYAHGRRG